MSTDARATRDGTLNRAWRRSIFAVFGLSGFGIANWLSRVPAARGTLHATAFEMGVLALGISIGSIIGFALASRLAGRWAPRTIIAAALGLSTLGLAGAGAGAVLPGGFAPTMIALVLLGAGNGTCNVAMNVEGTHLEYAISRPVMPHFHAVFSIGAAVGAGLGAVCAAMQVPAVVQLVAVAAAMALSLPLVTRALTPTATLARTAVPAEPAGPGTPSRPAARPAARRSTAWLETRTLLIGVVVLGMSFANGAANDWIALAMVDGHGAAQGLAAATTDVCSVAVVVARLFGPRVLTRLGRTQTVRASAVTALAGILLFVFAPNAASALGGAALWGLGIALAFPVGMSAAGDEPARAPERIAVVAAIGYSGSLVGPPLIGFVAGGTGILHALLIVPVLVVAAGLAAPVLRQGRRGANSGAQGALDDAA
ncbi:MFS transporter [Gryllotalpicola reticulitermitis]|uniref:MFS transporter n=1 Tax=Gryllotalpicola reticulitermitis TaxID=1184153 RepID=A0ABV8QAA9_9MICO